MRLHTARKFRSGPRSGRASDLAMAYGGTALVLAALGVALVRTGGLRMWPRHVDFGLFVLACAGVSLVYAMVNRKRAVALVRAVRERLRPGERVIGDFPAQLVADEERVRVQPGHSHVSLVVTNQRVMLYRPESGLDQTYEHELDEVTAAVDLGPADQASRRASMVLRLEFADGPALAMMMGLAVAHELTPAWGHYLVASERRILALIVAAEGATPSNPKLALATMLAGGQPTLRQLVLDEQYLRVLGDAAAVTDELWWYFHWEHITLSELQPPIKGLPEDWLSLRLTFHGRSWIVVCGRPTSIRRLREKAIAGGATS